jgi:hypothetical protein
MTEEREERKHVTTGLDCWCRPYPLAYGDELTYDEDGNLVEIANEALGGAEQQTTPQDGRE